ncbi:MAG: hypothetical protein V4473_01430 [Patescibacteria group bacterium]
MTYIKLKKLCTVIGLVLVGITDAPIFTFAQISGTQEMSDVRSVITYVLSITNILIPILFSGAFIVFFWGLSKFILNSNGSQAEIQKGKDYMLWGILALFVLVSARTILSLVANDLGIGNGSVIPFLPTGANPVK